MFSIPGLLINCPEMITDRPIAQLFKSVKIDISTIVSPSFNISDTTVQVFIRPVEITQQLLLYLPPIQQNTIFCVFRLIQSFPSGVKQKKSSN